MINKPTSANIPSRSTPLGVGKAILLGHIVVTVPALSIFLLFLGIGFVLATLVWISSDSIRPLWLYIVITNIPWMIGMGLGWLWWYFAIPRWYHWALKNGVPADHLQARAVATGLMWRNVKTFDQTKFRPNG